MKRMGAVFLSVMCICAAADTLSAQETINYGTISGRVADPQGAVVPGASVDRASIRNQSVPRNRDRSRRTISISLFAAGPLRRHDPHAGIYRDDAFRARDGGVGVRAADHSFAGRCRGHRRRRRASRPSSKRRAARLRARCRRKRRRACQ